LQVNIFGLKPRILGICFLKLPELEKDIPELTTGENYYDILMRFLFLELEKIIRIGLIAV
jgi:hypothetical protein